MVACNTVVSILFVDMGDVIKMWIISPIYVSYDPAIGWRFVCANRDWPVEPDTFDRLVQKGFCRFCISSRCKSEVDQLTVCIDGPPKVAPFTSDTDVGFVL